MPNYIQKFATIEQSCDWLRARTGGVWTLPRLLECHLKPYFWLDYKPGYEELFGGRVEGYRTWMIFAGDVQRLEFDGTSALVNMFTTHDGTLAKIEPGWTVPLAELRFKREELERVASILEGEALRQNPAPSGTPENAAPPVPVVTPAAATITRNKLRTDSLDAPIQKAIEQAGSLKTAAVFTCLKELARSGEALPFTGYFEGSALGYTTDDDTTALMTKNALDKRLAKLRKLSA